MEKEVALKIEGMTCSACVNRVEKKLAKLPSTKASVNLASETAIVQFDDTQVSIANLVDTINKAGYRGSLQSFSVQERGKYDFLFSLLLTVPFWVAMILGMVHVEFAFPHWAQFFLATIVQFVFGFRFYKGSWYALKNGSANMDVLVSLGTSAAYFFSIWLMTLSTSGHLYFEASASIITLVLLGKNLELQAKKKTVSSLHSLLSSVGVTAHKITDYNAIEKTFNNTEDISTESIHTKDILLVRQGESIPADGILLEGTAAVDESMLTGESLPVSKYPGQPVNAGTINVSGSFVMQAKKTGAETLLSNIVKKVEHSMATKPPIQKIADKVSGIFVPIVVVISFLVFWIHYAYHGDFLTSLVSGIAVLVVSCPCALGLAVPTSVAVALGFSARNGILFRNTQALESAASLNVICFDKTGTLTQGTHALSDINIFDKKYNEDTALQIAASLERGSSHPLARAIFSAWNTRVDNASKSLLVVKDFFEKAGFGVRGIIDSDTYFIGNKGWLLENEIHLPETNSICFDMGSIVYLANQKKLIAAFVFTDEIAESVHKALDELKKNGIKTAILSGDNEKTVNAIGKKLNVDFYHGSLSPEQKIEKMREYSQLEKVGMVGDGINDTPALAASDVSFAMGRGSNIAIECADITLRDTSIMKVPFILDIAKKTVKKIKQNLFFAFVYNVAAIPLAAMGYLSPTIAAAAMVLSSISVTLSSLHLNMVLKKNSLSAEQKS